VNLALNERIFRLWIIKRIQKFYKNQSRIQVLRIVIIYSQFRVKYKKLFFKVFDAFPKKFRDCKSFETSIDETRIDQM
jgi:hypothetical protein